MINENIEDKFISEEIKNTSFNKIDDFIDRLKKYLSVLIIITTFIGGLWQFSSLISIDLDYVRFFSLTQLLSDGITLIIPLVYIFFLIYSGYYFAYPYAKKFNDMVLVRKVKTKLKLIFLVSLIFLVCFILLGFYPLLKVSRL